MIPADSTESDPVQSLSLLERSPIVTLPDLEGRFFSLPLLDAWNEAFARLGTRSTGTEAQRFAIASPAWRRAPPRGLRVYRSPTSRGRAVGMTELRGPGDVAQAARSQASLSPAAWSHWGRLHTPPSGTAELLPGARDAVGAVSLMRAELYFERFCELTRARVNDWNRIGRPDGAYGTDSATRAAVAFGAGDVHANDDARPGA